MELLHSRSGSRARLSLGRGTAPSPASATTTSGCVFALALWNGKDPILKERLFGLTTNSEGNHGEDVKEYYFYLYDSTPTHSYMKYLYKYPHWQPFLPYRNLIKTSQRRGESCGPEYELLDTGVFNEDR